MLAKAPPGPAYSEEEITMALLHRGFDLLWRAVVVGVAFIAAMMLVGMIFGSLGLIPAAGAAPAGAAAGLFWILVAGILLGLYLGPLARRIPATRPQHVLIWTAVIFCNMGAVVLEGAYFAPDLVPLPLPILGGQQFLAALVAGGLLALLFAPCGRSAAFLATLHRRRWYAWLWRFLLAALSYLLFYFAFGALNYALVTGPYYASHAGGLTAPPGELVLAVELVRAPLLVLSVLLLILAAHTTRGRTLVLAGMTLFWVGGVVPLTLQIGNLPLLLLLASAVEIFLQNFLTGVVAGVLFWTGDNAAGRAAAPALTPA
jgi:hypothetical protein